MEGDQWFTKASIQRRGHGRTGYLAMAIPDRREHPNRQDQYQAGCIGRAPRPNEDRRRPQGIRRVICNPKRQPGRRTIAARVPFSFVQTSCRSGSTPDAWLNSPARLNVSNNEQMPSPFRHRLLSWSYAENGRPLAKAESIACGDLNAEPENGKFITMRTSALSKAACELPMRRGARSCPADTAI